MRFAIAHHILRLTPMLVGQRKMMNHTDTAMVMPAISAASPMAKVGDMSHASAPMPSEIDSVFMKRARWVSVPESAAAEYMRDPGQ